MTKKMKEIAHYGLTGWVIKRELPPVQISQDPDQAELGKESADAAVAPLHASSAAAKPFGEGKRLPAADTRHVLPAERPHLPVPSSQDIVRHRHTSSKCHDQTSAKFAHMTNTYLSCCLLVSGGYNEVVVVQRLPAKENRGLLRPGP